MKYTHGLVLLGCCMLSACGEGVVFQEDAQTPKGIWERGWNPAFSFDINDTLAAHDVFLDVRHTGDYPFSNLFAFVKLTGPDGGQLIDTVECTLADAQGRWYGKGAGFIRSDRFDAHVLYRSRNRFPRKGRYTIALEQVMRVEELNGIIDVGVSIERSRSN